VFFGDVGVDGDDFFQRDVEFFTSEGVFESGLGCLAFVTSGSQESVYFSYSG